MTSDLFTFQTIEIWIVPGYIFIALIYSVLPVALSVKLTGWSYLLSVLFFSYAINYTTNFLEKWVSAPYNFLFAFSLIFLIVFVTFHLLRKMKWALFYDRFFDKCLKWEDKPVILSLKSGKVYIGRLLSYPKDTKENSYISIEPVISGSRDKETQQVNWTTKYPNVKKNGDEDIEIFILRSEIVTFGKFEEDIFTHFYPSKTGQ